MKLLKELVAYHGTGKKHTTALKSPLFLATKSGDARWYSVNSSDDGKGVVYKGAVTGKIWDLTKKGTMNLTEILDELKIKYKEDPYFDCPAIKKHSPYDGSNENDIFYIPQVQQFVKSKGYDGVKIWDTLENTTIKAIVLFDTSKFEVEKVITNNRDYF